MIAETIIISIAAITIVGTVAGLRLAAREMGLIPPIKIDDDARRTAMTDTEYYMKLGMRDQMRALLACRGDHLPEEVRQYAEAWLNERPSPRQ